MSLLERALRSLRARAYDANSSGWYRYDVASADDQVYSTESTYNAVQPRVLSGPEQSVLTTWLIANRERFPWIYISEEMETGRIHGHWYPCLFDGRDIIGYAKLARDVVYIHDFRQKVSLARGIAFIYDIFVHPEYRGRQLAQMLLREVLNVVREHSLGEIFCHIENWNVASIRSFERFGFVRIGTVRYARVGPIKRLIIEGKSYRVGYITRWMSRAGDTLRHE